MRHSGRRALLLDGLKEFRGRLGGELAITLLRRIGEGGEMHDIREEGMIRALAELRRRTPPREFLLRADASVRGGNPGRTGGASGFAPSPFLLRRGRAGVHI